MQENDNLIQQDNNQTQSSQLKPMNVSDILDGMFVIYKNHFSLFLKIVAVYFVLQYTLDKISILILYNDVSANIGMLPIMLFGIFLLVIFAIGGLTYATAHVYLGRSITAGAALKRSMQRLLPLLGCSLLYSVVVFGLSVTIIGLPFGIYLGIRWGIYTLPLMFEDKTAMGSLRRSSELVKGTWWRVFGIMLLLFIICQMIQTIVSTSVSFIFFMITGFSDLQNVGVWESIQRIFAPTPLHIGWFLYLIQSFVSVGIASIAMPIACIGSTLLYFDLRIRKEAYDIELQVPN